jgi:aminoglycoside phosphotransferase
MAEKNIPGIRLAKLATDKNLPMLKDLKSLHYLDTRDCPQITDAVCAI